MLFKNSYEKCWLKIHNINNNYYGPIKKCGLSDEETIYNWSDGQRIANCRNHTVFRCYIDGIGYIYIKRYIREKSAAIIKGSTARKEFHSSMLMQKISIPQPEIICVATGYKGFMPTGSFIITREVEDADSLRNILDHAKKHNDDEDIKKLALALKEEILTMHAHNFCHWDLKPRNILVVRNSVGTHFVPIDSRNGRTICPWDRLFCIRRDWRFLLKEPLLAPYFK